MASKKIIRLLRISVDTYEIKIIGYYTAWCAVRAYDETDRQKLLTCQMLFNWWYNLYETHELIFLADVSDYIPFIDATTAEAMLTATIKKMESFYPKIVMKTARKTNKK